MPQPPPLDAQGNVIPHDCDEIAGTDIVIRRISDLQTVSKNGTRRISSLAYKASGGSNGSMSLDIEPFIVAAGLDPVAWVQTPRWIGSVKFTAQFLRSQKLQVGFDPVPETDNTPANPYHGSAWGAFSKAVQNALQDTAEWYVEIPGVDLK